jgi:cytochrome c
MRLIRTSAILLLAALTSGAQAQDPDAGQVLFNNACRTCHFLNAGDNRLGPHLHGVVGRKAGSVEGYGYSAALKGADLTWDKATLDRFIAAPDSVAPGHNMKPYPGMTAAEDRARIIAFLESRR